MDEIRIGLVGPGGKEVGSSRGRFIPQVCEHLEGVRVAAVFDVVSENADAAAEGITGCAAFGPDGWQAFLDSGINAAMIASPIPFHAQQSIDCLDRGLHVLSEVTASLDLDESRRLVEAAGASTATYMLAENCNFIDDLELFKRMIAAGLLGEVFHAEGGYLHDCRYLWREPDGGLTWRAVEFQKRGVYCTHSLGPILEILADRVSSVSCLATGASIMDAGIEGTNNHNMLMATAGGRTVMVRVDSMSPQPYRCYYRFQGTKGVVEYTYGQDGSPRISVDGNHEWQDAEGFRKQYIADRLALTGPAAEIGHGSNEFWMMKAWSEAVKGGEAAPIDVHAAMDCTLPGIVAFESVQKGGAPVTVPDSRDWA